MKLLTIPNQEIYASFASLVMNECVSSQNPSIIHVIETLEGQINVWIVLSI